MDDIVGTAESGVTNARVESANNGIELIARMAYGYRNFGNLRAKVMRKRSGLPVELSGGPLEEKKTEGKAA